MLLFCGTLEQITGSSQLCHPDAKPRVQPGSGVGGTAFPGTQAQPAASKSSFQLRFPQNPGLDGAAKASRFPLQGHCSRLLPEIPPQPSLALSSPYLKDGLKEALPSCRQHQGSGRSSRVGAAASTNLALHSQELQHPQGLQLFLLCSNVKVCPSHALTSPRKVPRKALIQRLSCKTCSH